ncbi:MAG: YbaB/EbfC family nucleoid-associated protein [Bacilli bacterium]|nr:YbaB/EbfC family nucleoid-associated protein [Bacilli bacterium]
MNIQQLMMQAQKMKRELQKAKEKLAEQEFKVSKGGAVTVIVMGDKSVKSIEIDDDAFDKDNKDMIQDMIAMAINEAMQQVVAAEEEINERITGQTGGMGF